MTNIQPHGFILIVAVWVVGGQGPSYEYEPFYYPRTRGVAPTPDSLDLTLRAQNSQYRSIYRNRNYYAHPPQKTTTNPPIISTAAYVQRSSASHVTSSTLGTTQSDEPSDGPIVFAEPSPVGTYVRTVETYQSTVVANQVGEGVGGNGKIQYLPSFGAKVSSSCAKNSLYCESFDSYPTELINEVLSRTFTPKEFQDVYGETTDNSTTTTDLKLLERTGLISSNYEETPLCSSVERTIYPRVARNKDNKWMYVVNHDQYLQGVRVEKCLDDDGQPCVFGETAPAGYQTACRQKYIYKKLLALTPEGKTSTDTFKLPSCCVCFAKKVPFNRIFSTNTSPAALTTSRRPLDEVPEPDYDDLPSTTRSGRKH